MNVMTDHLATLQTLCDSLREAIRKDRGAKKDLPRYRRTERANLHHRLVLLVPVYRDLRKRLLQAKGQQNQDNFRFAPERVVATLLSYFASGQIFVPVDHPLWSAPLPASLVQACLKDEYFYVIPLNGTRALRDDRFVEYVKHVEGKTLADYRDALRTTDIPTGKPGHTVQMEEVAQAQALKVKLKSILTPAEFDLMSRHIKVILAKD